MWKTAPLLLLPSLRFLGLVVTTITPQTSCCRKSVSKLQLGKESEKEGFSMEEERGKEIVGRKEQQQC